MNAAPETHPAPTGASRRKLLPVLIIVLTGVVLAILQATRPEPPITEPQEKEWLVEVVSAEPVSEHPELSLIGKVESPFDSTLSAAVSADVAELLVREGDVVRTGDLLVQLDAREWRLYLEQRSAELVEIEAQRRSERNRHQADQDALAQERTLQQLADTQVERQTRLNQSQLVAQERIDDARSQQATRALSVVQRTLAIDDHPARMAQLEARLDKARAALERARLDLQRTEIRAPFEGTVTRLDVAPGERLQIGQTVLRLYDHRRTEIRAQLPERHIAQVRSALAEGQAITAAATQHGQRIALQLARISGHSASGGIDLFLSPTDTTVPTLTLGATLSVNLSLPQLDQVVSLPLSALYGVNRIYRIEDGRLVLLEVEVAGKRYGVDEPDRILVRSPALGRGDRIITTQLPNAVTGLKVKAREH
jgi:RND family efflux transporter MFP subunit